jgi:uncharacterized membrane protein YfcA
MTLRPPRKPRLWIWLLWLACFYSTWAWLVVGGGRWDLVAAHWPTSLTMFFGSYVAGATPMGGGTVAFPILVLAFDLPATLGRDFSFAVQSIGMTSASIFILARRQPLAWSMLRGALLGTVVGTPLGIAFLAPHVPALLIKLVFAVVWASFGVLHLYRLREIAANTGVNGLDERWDFKVGLGIGLLGGAGVAAVTGVGIDMVLYAALVLLCRADLKVAIPISVVIMAATSLVGIGFKGLTGGIEPGVFGHWLAAAPVVALGAPLGAFVVGLVGRTPTLLFVALLCVGQFAWTCWVEWGALGVGGVLAALLAVGACLLGFEHLRGLGRRMAAGEAIGGPATPPAPGPGPVGTPGR